MASYVRKTQCSQVFWCEADGKKEEEDVQQHKEKMNIPDLKHNVQLQLLS